MNKVLRLVAFLFSCPVLFAQSQDQTNLSSPTPANSTQSAQPQNQVHNASPRGFVLEDGTPVKLRINRTLSSADAHVGDTVDFEVLEDVLVNNVLVAPKGGLAFATVTEAQGKRRMARGGKLDINIDYVRLVSDEKAALRAVKAVRGGGHTGAMTGGIVATSLVFWPAAPFFLFMHGKEIAIPKGTEITAYINGDMKLDIAKFRGGTADPVSTAQAQLQVSSTPDDADIEIDGNFVGSTPSTLGVATGQHRLVVKKNGLKPWDRMITVSTGLVRVNASLEPDSNETADRNASQGSSAEPRKPAVESLASGFKPAGTERDEEPSIGALFYGEPNVRHDGVEVSVGQHGGPAGDVGIAAGDIILSLDGAYIYTINDLRTELQSHSQDERIVIKYRRASLTYETSINLRSSKPQTQR